MTARHSPSLLGVMKFLNFLGVFSHPEHLSDRLNTVTDEDAVPCSLTSVVKQFLPNPNCRENFFNFFSTFRLASIRGLITLSPL